MAKSHLELNVVTFCYVITDSRLPYDNIFRKCKMRMKIMTHCNKWLLICPPKASLKHKFQHFFW